MGQGTITRLAWLASICAVLAAGCNESGRTDPSSGANADTDSDTDSDTDADTDTDTDSDTGSDTGSDTSDTDTSDWECEDYLPGEPPVAVTPDCGDGSAHHEPYTGGTALRVIGVYQAGSSDAMTDCQIELDLYHDVALYFSSYESTHWIVTNDGPGEITEIIVNGYEPQDVTAPDGVPVTISNTEYYGSAYDWNDYDAHEVAAVAESQTGLELTSFHGCYEANHFTMVETCDEPVEPPDLDCEAETFPHDGPDLSVLGSDCADVVAESYFCLTLTQANEVALLGLDTGTVCSLVATDLAGPSHVNSIGWLEGYLYSCGGHNQKLARVDIGDGTVEEAFVWCEAVAAYDGGLLAEPSWAEGEFFGQMWFYTSFVDALCQDPQVLSVDENNTRHTVYGNTLYSAWHSTNEVDVLALPSGDYEGSIALEGYDTWVNGMSVIDGELLVMSATWPEGRVAVFDMSGGFLWEVEVATTLRGLYCLAGGV